MSRRQEQAYNAWSGRMSLPLQWWLLWVRNKKSSIQALFRLFSWTRFLTRHVEEKRSLRLHWWRLWHQVQNNECSPQNDLHFWTKKKKKVRKGEYDWKPWMTFRNYYQMSTFKLWRHDQGQASPLAPCLSGTGNRQKLLVYLCHVPAK